MQSSADNTEGYQEALNGVLVELRSILRQQTDLAIPRREYKLDTSRGDSGPRYYLRRDARPNRVINGLRFKTKTMHLDDEPVIDMALSLSKSLWHFKDYIKKLISTSCVDCNLEEELRTKEYLLICADLANRKKHAENKNRSKIDPRIGLVKYDLTQVGEVELFYDGKSKDWELIVTHPNEIPFEVQIEGPGRQVLFTDARQVFCNAFDEWKGILSEHGLLDSDDETCQMLKKLIGL